MVTVIEEPNPWAEIGNKFGKGVSEAYEQRADTAALQKAVENLPPDASPQQVLKAITGTQTFNQQAKKDAINNVVKVEEFREKKRASQATQAELERTHKANEDISRQRNEIYKGNSERRAGIDAQVAKNQELKSKSLDKKLELDVQKLKDEQESKERKRYSTKYLIQNSDLPPDLKEQMLIDNDKGLLDFDAVQKTLNPNAVDVQKIKNEGQLGVQELRNEGAVQVEGIRGDNSLKTEEVKNKRQIAADIRKEADQKAAKALKDAEKAQKDADIEARRLEKEQDKADKEQAKEDRREEARQREIQSARYLVENSKLSEEDKNEMLKDIDEGRISYNAARDAIRNKKEEKVPLSAKAIDPDQLRRIQEVRNSPEYATATPGQVFRMMSDNGVSKDNSEAESKSREADDKLKRDEDILFHKESEKYHEEIQNSVKGAKNQLAAIEDSFKALKSGNVKPTSMANVFKFLGPVGEKIANAIQNKDQAVISASIPAFLEGRKELFGVRLSDADLRLLQDKLPDIGKSVEVNETILGLMRRYSEMSLLRADVAQQIVNENGGKFRPAGFANKVEKRFDELTEPVTMIFPDTKNPNGKSVDIPAYKVSAALKKGGRLANE
jgi:hypothetical protein